MYSLLTQVTATTDKGSALKANYTYTDDYLTGITTATTAYTFTYGNFGLRSAVKIGTAALATYGYETGTNNLISLDYGNEDGVKYTYDQQNRLTQEKYYEDGSTTVAATVKYLYDNDGALSKVIDSETGITQHYIYDLLGRMGLYRETGTNYEAYLRYTYDSDNNLSQLREYVDGNVRNTYFAYDDDNRVTAIRKNKARAAYTYDKYGRVSQVVSSLYNSSSDNSTVLTESYAYNNMQVTEYHSDSVGDYDVKFTYGYDANGNITSVTSGGKTTSYVYDSANQLIRENNEAAGKTTVWTYDNGGNILSRKVYAFTEGDVSGTPTTVNYTYSTGSWKDQLVSYNEQTIDYDPIGNPTTYRGWALTWKRGRELAIMEKGSTIWNFTYNADGLRTKRTNGTTAYTYVYLGGQLVKSKAGSNTMYFSYDASGTPLSVLYNSTYYYYVTNLQGDVVAILNQSGNQVVGYTYDAWGNLLSMTGSMATTLGVHNPLRYRGYVYDTETGLYYLQSRYYDPEMGRFINADTQLNAKDGTLGFNLYAYSNNNPAMYSDPTGHSILACIIVGAIIGAAVGGTIAAVASKKTTGSVNGKAVVGGIVGGGIVGGLAGWGIGAAVAGASAASAAGTAGAAAAPVVQQTIQQTSTALQTYYPPNDGFSGAVERVTLEAGTVLQRIGSLYGSYVAPAGTPPETLSLPYDKIGQAATFLQLQQPIEVLAGRAAPWFGQIGGGTQYLLDTPIMQLLKDGVIKIVGG